MSTPDPTDVDVADLIERAWRALKRRPFDVVDDECVWFVSSATRNAMRAHRYEGPGSNPITERFEGLERRHVVRLFNVRVVFGEYPGVHDLLLAMEV